MDNHSYYDSELLYDTGEIIGSPLFSVCLSTYNFESSVEQSIRTIINQSFDDYEVVIHDDCSSDETCDVIINCLKSFDMFSARRIRLYRAFENAGILANRLRAFAHSSGKWLIQTDGDDFSPADRLENTMLLINGLDYEPMLISTNHWNWDEGTSYEEVVKGAAKINCQQDKRIKLIDIVNQREFPNGSSGFILNRYVFESFYNSIPPVRIIADDPVFARRALLLGDVHISSIPVYYCRISNNSASGAGVAGKKWIIDRYNRWNLLLQDIKHIREDNEIPVEIKKKVERQKKKMLLDSKLIDCSNVLWPFLWLKMVILSPQEAKFALKKRIKLLLLGSVNASFRKSKLSRP